MWFASMVDMYVNMYCRQLHRHIGRQFIFILSAIMTTLQEFLTKCEHYISTILSSIEDKLQDKRYESIYQMQEYDTTLLDELNDFIVDYEDAIISGKEPPTSFITKVYDLISEALANAKNTRSTTEFYSQLNAIRSKFDDTLRRRGFCVFLNPEATIDGYDDMNKEEQEHAVRQVCENHFLHYGTKKCAYDLHRLHTSISSMYTELKNHEREYQMVESSKLHDPSFHFAIIKLQRLNAIKKLTQDLLEFHTYDVANPTMFQSLVGMYGRTIFADVKKIINDY